MALEKASADKISTLIDTGKQTSKIVAPLIINQVESGLQNEAEINIDNCVQFN